MLIYTHACIATDASATAADRSCSHPYPFTAGQSNRVQHVRCRAGQHAAGSRSVRSQLSWKLSPADYAATFVVLQENERRCMLHNFARGLTLQLGVGPKMGSESGKAQQDSEQGEIYEPKMSKCQKWATGTSYQPSCSLLGCCLHHSSIRLVRAVRVCVHRGSTLERVACVLCVAVQALGSLLLARWRACRGLILLSQQFISKRTHCRKLLVLPLEQQAANASAALNCAHKAAVLHRQCSFLCFIGERRC